ncbi:chromosome partitioning protein [Catalinimonas alkaloidigena]|uniref:Chromosome partitioning protein n=1 Tax=Catalinimonas alkaloidigena TaxID=1075417 RepID=A0A1G9TJ89_9BACT|nr:AAA family ATPase [Catalinimonas alkaloidigena]SDM47618.1 chromosome partitioning protein [Catalinimonas alkaloidigena]
MIYVVAGTKGGTGKSTIATNLTVLLTVRGRDVLLVDADEQETSSDFTTLRDTALEGKTGYTAVKLTGPTLRTQVLNQKERYQDIVIDVGGRDTGSQRAALTVADVVLVPFRPKSFDVWTLEKVEALIEEARSFNPTLQAFSFLNDAFTNPAVKDNQLAAEALQQSELISFLGVIVHSRKAFSDATSAGLGVIELENQDAKAIHEITTLFDTVTKLA